MFVRCECWVFSVYVDVYVCSSFAVALYMPLLLKKTRVKKTVVIPTQSTHTLRCTSARLIIVLLHSCKAHYNCAIVYVVIRNAQYIVTHVFKNVTASVAKLKIRTEI